jgi:hypothetical protein
MLKRILLVILLSCFLPEMAHAATWSLSTWARNAGGTIQVGSDAPRTNLQGQLITTYDFSATPSTTVTVTPKTGYVTSQVILNGTPLSYPTDTSFTVNGPTAQSVQAYFALQKFSVTSSVAVNVGGTVNPTSIVGLTTLAVAKTVTFTPASTAFTISNISGVPPGAVQNPDNPAPGQAVTLTFPVGFKFTSNVALVVTFTSQNPVAIAGSQQTAFTGAAVMLNGADSLTSGGVVISSYLWSQTSGPTVTLSNPDAASASFLPTVAGIYTFSLTLQPGGSTVSTTVTVYESLTGLVRDQCYNCHSSAGVGVASNVFGNWSSSGHKTKGVVCSQCHNTVLTGGHPGPLRKGSVSTTTFDYTGSAGSGNFCVSCHSPAILTDFAASKHSIRAGSASCSFCHINGVHNTSVACTDCHKPGNSYGLEWPPPAFTFHSSFTDSKNICKVCHTTHNPKVLSIKTSCP